MEQPKERKQKDKAESAVDETPLFPVRKVVLSKTGIGYFEREDNVDGGKPFELFFKSGDMNDVLKSLTMIDISGKGDTSVKVGGEFSFGKGKSTTSQSDIATVSTKPSLVSSISYESTKPFDKQLDDLSISLNENSSLRDLLAQVKGTPVQVEIQRSNKREVVEGTIIGLERKTLVRPTRHEANFLALLVQGKAIQYFNMNSIIRLRFLNELMQKDLRHLLNILLQAKKKDLKSVTGYTRGTQGQRTIRASYIVEAPVWKTTYRLLFNTGKEAKSIIEGWALVDNTQNEDWRSVELSLVSGASNSFIYDLYNPRFAARTEIEVEQEETLAPPVLEDAVAQHDVSSLSEATVAKKEKSKRQAVVRAKAMPAMSMAPPPPMAMACAAPAPPMMARRSVMREECEYEEEKECSYGSAPLDDLICADMSAPVAPPVEFSRAEASSSIEVNSEGKKMEMADLFQYKITSAVNVNRNQSALVPFLHTQFNGVKASIYNKNVRDENPLAVIKFKNTFGVPLESGPLCIFEDDVYVGEAMLPRVKVNEEIYTAYAVDLKTTVTMTESSELRDVYKAEAATYDWERGRLYLRRWRVYEFVYVIDNKNEQAIEHFYLEHPKKASELVETAEPDERLTYFYRFKLEVPAKQVVKFVVKERSAEDQVHYLTNVTKDQIEEWSAAGYLPADVKKTLERILKKREKDAELQKKSQRASNYLSSANTDISRIDGCLGSLALSKSSLYAEQNKFRDFFTKQLNAAKTEQTKYTKEVNDIYEKIKKNNKKKEDLVNSVRFSKTFDVK